MSCMNCVLPNLVMSIITQLIRVKIMLKFFRKQTAAEEARELYEATSNKQYSGLITILPIVLNQCSNAQRANTQLSIFDTQTPLDYIIHCIKGGGSCSNRDL